MTTDVETLYDVIEAEGKALAYIVRAGVAPAKTRFVTPSDSNFQVGFIVYPAGGEIQRHLHKPLRREIVGTAEALLIRSGSCAVDVFSDERVLVRSELLRAGDLIVFLAGGHGFRLLEDCVMLEIKQGPYSGVDEKTRF
jgi:hypothetical protein